MKKYAASMTGNMISAPARRVLLPRDLSLSIVSHLASRVPLDRSCRMCGYFQTNTETKNYTGYLGIPLL